ncbi:MAG: class I SAM-dependent methyltransferase [Candidatus Binatia bacterium]
MTRKSRLPGRPHTDQGHRWNTTLYDSKHSYVWKYGAELIELLSPKPGERILDLGCGTGHLTHKIAEFGADVVGIDRDSDMISQALKSYPKLKFALTDGRDFHFAQPFDAVFSNAALHWMKEPERVAACIWVALKRGGRFVAEFGGKGNVNAIVSAISEVVKSWGPAPVQSFDPWYFPSLGEYSTLLEKQGFDVTFGTLFERPTPLEGGDEGMRNWLAVFARSHLLGLTGDQRSRAVELIEQQLRPLLYRDGTWFADYKRIRVVAVKE